jgi:hypothetical protein
VNRARGDPSSPLSAIGPERKSHPRGVCVIVYVQFSSVGAGMVWGGGSSLHSGIELGGVGPERGLRGGGRRGWCEE